ARGVLRVGNRRPGLLLSYSFPSLAGSNYKFVDLTNGVKPYLLAEMRNNLGSATRIEYRPSTWFFLRDADQERPWASHLPFPVQCVARVERLDEISRIQLTSEYTYHHGHWAGEVRESRGFGCVVQRDTETSGDYHTGGLFPGVPFAAIAADAFSPPVETRTWFHQGGDE